MHGQLSLRGMVGVAAVFTLVFCLSARAEKKVPPQKNGLVQNGGSICDSTDGNIAANCGFETGDLPPEWTYKGDPTFVGVDSGDVAHSGTWGGYFVPVGDLGCITQTLDTPALFYDLSAWIRNFANPNELQVWWGGTLVDDQIDMKDFDYRQMSWPGIETPDSTTDLMFCFRNDPDYIYIDDIVVTESAGAPSK